MKKITAIGLSITAALFLSACGGDSGSGEDSDIDKSNNATMAELADNQTIAFMYNISKQTMDQMSDILHSNSASYINEKEMKDPIGLSCEDIPGFELVFTQDMGDYTGKSYISFDYTRTCDEIIYTEKSLNFYGPYNYAQSYSLNY